MKAYIYRYGKRIELRPHVHGTVRDRYFVVHGTTVLAAQSTRDGAMSCMIAPGRVLVSMSGLKAVANGL